MVDLSKDSHFLSSLYPLKKETKNEKELDFPNSLEFLNEIETNPLSEIFNNNFHIKKNNEK